MNLSEIFGSCEFAFLTFNEILGISNEKNKFVGEVLKDYLEEFPVNERELARHDMFGITEDNLLDDMSGDDGFSIVISQEFEQRTVNFIKYDSLELNEDLLISCLVMQKAYPNTKVTIEETFLLEYIKSNYPMAHSVINIGNQEQMGRNENYEISIDMSMLRSFTVNGTFDANLIQKLSQVAFRCYENNLDNLRKVVGNYYNSNAGMHANEKKVWQKTSIILGLLTSHQIRILADIKSLECEEVNIDSKVYSEIMNNSISHYNSGFKLFGQGNNDVSFDNKAAHHYQKSAFQCHRLAQCTLGLMYKQGRGVPKNISKAIFWLEKSAKQKFDMAQANLGNIYMEFYQEDNSINNIARCYCYFEQASLQNNEQATHNFNLIKKIIDTDVFAKEETLEAIKNIKEYGHFAPITKAYGGKYLYYNWLENGI